tara:strand:- start:352 stop:747 length:396 start_codon:yes stop_codon:yes gene_type:complete
MNTITIYDKHTGEPQSTSSYINEVEKEGILAMVTDNHDYVENNAPPTLDDYKWTGSEWQELPKPQELALPHIRTRRDYLLKQCDWTQANDSPLSDAKKTEWATYRQALRDLPDSYTDTDEASKVVWPEEPE